MAPAITMGDLIAKLRRIEALHAGAATEGEQSAADAARWRIMRRMYELQAIEQPEEYRFTIDDPWARQLFAALARRYELRPFRYKRQRKTTIMLKVLPSFLDETLWPQFEELQRELQSYLQSVTDKVIAEAIHADASDAAEETQRLLTI